MKDKLIGYGSIGKTVIMPITTPPIPVVEVVSTKNFDSSEPYPIPLPPEVSDLIAVLPGQAKRKKVKALVGKSEDYVVSENGVARRKQPKPLSKKERAKLRKQNL